MLARLKRPIAAFISLWFLLVMVEPEAVHSCPVHSSVAAETGAHAGHHMANAAPHESGKDSGAICSCPGDCAVPAVGALPPQIASVEATIVFQDDRAVQASQSPAPGRREFFLPFAIGPPALNS